MALAAGFAALPARAQPSGAQVIHGAATFTQQGANLTVTTQNGAGTGHSAINWQSFNVPKGSTTHFAQPNAASTSINRVVAPNPSSILGTLSSNGHLVLVNPSGIAVGAGAVVDTARFTASTLRMSDADATAGRLRFEGGQGAQLRVDGQVVARQGDVVLIGQNVEAGQKAIIESPNGATVLAAGQKVHVTGRGLEGIHFEVQAPGDKAVNLGTLKGDAVGIFAGTLKHSGLVQARAVTTAGGKVVLKAADMAEVSGTVTAQGAGGAGGSVDVLGARVGVLAGATIDTSNSAGGGQIRVGGDYKGQNAEVPNAQVTYVDAGATLRANATERGDGGRVIVWADDTARVHGTVEARGGPQGGNGGFIETSGKRVLSVEGVRASAAAGSGGKAGTWLLDPANITIQVNGPSTALHSEPWFMPSATEESVLTAATLNAALAGGDGTVVLITTDTGNTRPGNGDIVFDGRLEAGGPILLRRGTAGTATLLLQAAGDVVFRGSTTIEAGEETPTPTPAPRRLYVMLNPGLRSAEARVRSEAGSTLALQASHADHDVELFVGRGATWTNEGTVTLNANGRITLADTNSYVGATLNNLAGGVINGAAGARGGIVGFDDGFGGRGWGSLHNAGTIQLSQGSVEVAGFTQTGGSTGLVDGANFRARTQFHVAGAFVFDGGNFIVSQSSGDLVVPASASITAAGSASFIARQGDLLVQGPITAATDLTLVADPGDSSGGVIQIQAPLTAGRSLALIANGWSSTLNASIVQGAAGAIHADELLVRSYGQARLTHEGNVVHSVAASAFEFELVNNADVLRVRSLEHDGIGGRGAFAGGILTMAGARIDNRSGGGLPQGLAPGSIVVDSYIDAGSVDLTAAGDIVASHIKTYGGNPSAGEGNVRLQAAGRVEFGSIHTFVEDWAAGGGYSGGSVHVSAGTSISGGEVVTDALAGEAPAQRAGDVLLSAGNGSVSLEGHISARGGAANVSLGATGGGVLVTGSIDASGGSLGGGAGGVVIVTATEGIAIGSIQADGAGGSLAAGGAGGAITLSSGGGGVTVHQGLSARGGDSEGGMGGAGGRIVIASTAAGGLHLQGTHLVAAGGDGAAWSSANRGPGGSIRVSAAGTLSLNGTSLDARAGSAGPIAGTHAGAGLVELQAPSIVLDGTNHLGGNAHVRADGATAGSGVVSVQPGQLQWSDGNWLHVQGQQGVVLAGSIDAGAKAAALPGTTLGLYAVAGDIVQAGGTLDVPRLHVAADAGQVLLEQVNAVDAVAGTAGGDIRLRNGGPLLVGSVATPHGAATGLHAGGAIDLRTSGDLVVASAVETHGGSLTLVAGDAALGGSGRLLVNAGLDTTGGGATPLGAAILLRSGSLVGDGPSVSITGSGNRVAVNAGAGLLQVEGAGHVQVAQADLSGGAIELRPFESRFGVLALDGATLTATAPTGTISADFAGGVFVFDSTVATVGGGIHLGSDLGAVVVTSSSLVSAGGPLRLQGGASAAPVDNFGVSLWDASLDAGAGTIHVSGRSADPFTDGVLLVGQVHLAAAGGTLVEGQHLSAEPLAEGGLGVRVGDPGRAAILTGHGALTLRGSSAAPAHAGIALQDAHVDRNGSVSIEGSSATGPIGVRIADSTIHTQGHHQQVTSTSGVSIHASTLATSGGNLMVAGGNADYVAPVGSAAVDITGGSSLHAGTGNVTIAATTVEGTAFSFVTDAPGGGLTISGADVVITGNTTGGTALKIDNETITATHSLTLTAVDGGLEITAGSQVVNTGTGPMVLQAQSSHPGAPAFLRVAAGATVNSAGPIRLSADTLELLAPVVSATGQIQVVPLDLSRPITIGDGAIAGTLNFSQSALDLLVGDTVLIGGDTFTGGIRVLSSVTIGNRLLSLVNLGDVAQDVGARLTVGSLFVDARSVNLHDVLIADGGSLAGRAHGGAFGVRNQSAGGTLRIGDLLGVSGVSATGGPVTITTGGALQLAAPVRSDAGGNAITLVAASLATQAGGSLQTTDGSGRWLVYLDAPTAALAGGPLSGNQAVWGTSFDTTPPDVLAATGHRYVFEQSPLVTISASAVSKEYDGLATFLLAPSFAGVVDAAAFGGVFSQDMVTASLHVPTATKNVGQYDIELQSHTMPAGYTLAPFVSAKATITPRELLFSATTSGKVYDGGTGATVTLTGTNGIAGDDLAIQHASATYADKHAGAGKLVTVGGITLAGADALNYTVVGAKTTTGDITRRGLTLTANATDKVYDGTTAASVTFADDRIGGDVLTVGHNAANFADKHVGIGKLVTIGGITLSGDDAANYTIVGGTSAAARITPRALNLTVSASDKVYDGATTASVAFGDNRIAGDVLAVSHTGAHFSDKHAGANKTVTIGGIALSGDDAGNYTILGGTSALASITPRVLNLTANASDKVYDGTTTASVAFGDNRVTGDALTVSHTGASFADKNAGTGKAVTIGGITLGGADAANYTVAGGTSATAAIIPRALNITASAGDKVYDGTTAASVTFGDDRIGGDVLAVGHNAANFADKNAGSGKLVTVGGLSLGGADAGNYTLTGSTTTATAAILRRSLAVSLTASKVYDGTTVATASLSSDRIAGDDVVVGHSGAAFNDKNAGTGKVVTASGLSLSGTDAANYVVSSSATGSGVITPRALTVTATAQNKVYDGTTAAQVALGDDRIAGDQLTVAGTGNFANKHAGTGKVVSIAAVTLGGADAGNYVISGPLPSATADILKRTVSLGGITAQNKTYDGTTAATLQGTASLVGAVAGDSVSVSGTATGAFADKNAGTNKPVTMGGALALAGADAGNYDLAPLPVLSATIEPRRVTILVNDQSKEQGTELSFKGTEFTIRAGDLVGNERITSVTLESPGAPSGALAGTYAITGRNAVGDAASGFVAGNYVIDYTAAFMRVSAAAPAVQQVQNAVNTFTSLFVQEATAQQEQRAAVLANLEEAAAPPPPAAAPAAAAEKKDGAATEEKKDTTGASDKKDDAKDDAKKDDKKDDKDKKDDDKDKKDKDKKKDGKDGKSTAKKKKKEAIVSEESCKP